MRYFIGISLFIIGLPLLVIPFIGYILAVPFLFLGTLILISAMSSSSAKKTARETAKALVAAQANQIRELGRSTVSSNLSDADRKWGVLCEVDVDLRRAADRVGRLGPAAEMELKTKFLAVNDKRYLEQIIRVIEAKHNR